MASDQRICIELHPDRIGVEIAAAHPLVQRFVAVEDVDLQLDLITVGIAVVEGKGGAVVDGPVGLDAGGL